MGVYVGKVFPILINENMLETSVSLTIYVTKTITRPWKYKQQLCELGITTSFYTGVRLRNPGFLKGVQQ